MRIAQLLGQCGRIKTGSIERLQDIVPRINQKTCLADIGFFGPALCFCQFLIRMRKLCCPFANTCIEMLISPT
ncbi:hypothetical protein [Phyllobacterium meliloti]|uniref:hypothetical protein n=1 Tax=Phyllobacterium meliloti TaxID=555317 RepID=UPI001F15F7AD|nr:hypothetical protein [Phyllobacterium sp. T1293]UGX88203.1 hypothetical protein LLE53_011895 [Phyllobacterium sp. T1293]